jgi:hypothetical protein
MPVAPREILAALFALVLVGFVLGLLWFALAQPGRKARELAANLSHRLGLNPVSAGAFAGQLGFAAGGAIGMAYAAGQWNGLRAGILLQAARSKYVGRYTCAIIAWPDARAATLALQRTRATFWSAPTPLVGPMAGAFTANGPAPEIQRVFPPQVQAMLLDFPR